MGRKREDLSEASALTVRTQGPLHPQSDASSKIDVSAEAQASDQTFDQALRTALAESRIADARTLVADAEAVLHACGTSGQQQSNALEPTDLATAKARIAMATGDRAAARAILIQAIEANPKTAALKALMTEVMMADGRATDVRPILKHLGNDAANGSATDATDNSSGSDLRDTSG